MAIYKDLSAVLGNKNVQNGMRIRFTVNDMSSQPRLEAWDSEANLGTQTAPSDEILVGTVVSGNDSWLAVVDTENVAPGANWYPGVETPGDASPNRLEGLTAYCMLDSIALGAAPQTRRFNLALNIPSDAAAGTTGHTPVLACRYYYTGAAPTVIWESNDGSEAAPNWVTFTAGGAGYTIWGAGPDTTVDYLDPVTKPFSGFVEVNEYWIQTG